MKKKLYTKIYTHKFFIAWPKFWLQNYPQCLHILRPNYYYYPHKEQFFFKWKRTQSDKKMP